MKHPIIALLLPSDSRAFPTASLAHELAKHDIPVQVQKVSDARIKPDSAKPWPSSAKTKPGAEKAWPSSAKKAPLLGSNAAQVVLTARCVLLQPFFRSDIQAFAKVIGSIVFQLELDEPQSKKQVPPIIIGGPSIRVSDIQDIANIWPGHVYFASQQPKAIAMIVSNFVGAKACRPKIQVALGKTNDLNVGPTESRAPTCFQVKTIRPQTTFAKRNTWNIPLKQIWPHISHRTLFQLHLGYRRAFEKDIHANKNEAVRLYKNVEKIKGLIEENNWLQVTGESVLVQATSDGKQTVTVYMGDKKINLIFPRVNGKCIADYVNATYSKFGFFVVTSGKQWIPVARQFLEGGDWESFRILQALAFQSAEAGAEYMHHELEGRAPLSKRYSPGYSLCPDLTFQKLIFEIIFPHIKNIGVTGSMMMEPENSVSGFVVFDPKATY